MTFMRTERTEGKRIVRARDRGCVSGRGAKSQNWESIRLSVRPFGGRDDSRENCDSTRRRRKTNGHNDRANPIIADAYGQCSTAARPLVDNFHLCQVPCARNIFTPFDTPTIRRINRNSRKKRPAPRTARDGKEMREDRKNRQRI